MSRIAIKSGGPAALPEWRAGFAAAAPDLEVIGWWEPGAEQAEYALVWDPEPGRLAAMPKLRCVFGAGAGVDLITADPGFPRGVPLVRMAPPEAAQRMGEYIAWAALHLLRDGQRIARQEAARHWDEFHGRCATDLRVGVMGLGVMGLKAAEMLRALGFAVAGWSRTRKDVTGMHCFAGDAELGDFLARTDLLVALLPATEATRGILSAPLLAQLPRGAMLVNAGRGMHQRVDDIIAALDSGQLSAAVLDVFETEPLPPDHPAWTHPRLTVTPHLASTPSRPERARFVAAQIARIARGEAPAPLWNPVTGY